MNVKEARDMYGGRRFTLFLGFGCRYFNVLRAIS